MLVTDQIDPQELTGFVRELQFPNVNMLARFLPDQQRNALEYEFNRTDKERRRAAQFRPFDVESPIGDRPGMARVRGKVPPISKKMVLGEEEQLLLDAVRRQTRISPEMVDQVFNDARNLTSDIRDRIEFARGQVLSTGKVTFTNDLGIPSAEIDYAIPSANFVTPSGTDWTLANAATAVPITDMDGWIRTVYMPANGNARPAVGITSSTVMRALAVNAQIRSFIVIAGAVGATLAILTDDQVQTVLRAQGLPPLIVCDEVVNLVGAGTTRVIPEGTVVFLPAPSVDNFGETFFGPTVEALNLARAGYLPVASAPGLAGTQMITFDPEHQWTKVNGLVIPVLKDPAAVMVADVA